MDELYPHYIEFRHVYKTFDRPVLVDVNFQVNAGETMAIIGRSGVGKSVTLSHIMGFQVPDSGRVIVRHTDVTEASENELRRIRKKVTMVFQNGALFDSLTVAENILFSLELRDDYDAENREEIVRGLLRMVDLLDYYDAYPSDLSTGYKRAVAIARALASEPECVLYDEPTTMVDPIMSDHLGNLMLRLKSQLNLTSVVVTHDLDLMRLVADRVVVLHEGQVIYFGPVTEMDRCDHPHIREFLAMDRVEIELDVAFEQLLDVGLAYRAHFLRDNLTAFEHQQRGDAADVIPHGGSAILIDIQLANFRLAGKLVSDRVHGRRHHAARAAPLCPKVHQNRDL